MTESATPRHGLEVVDLKKSYFLGNSEIEVLKGASLTIEPGQSIALTGPSGSGKSTLLHIVGTLDEPSAGRVVIDGLDPFRFDPSELARFRNSMIGFIFQDAFLLPQYSILENVLLPTMAHRSGKQLPTARAQELLKAVGLGHRLDHRPAELSGGERLRVAVARSLVNRPRLLLCDEPTGSLDPATADTVADLLLDLHRQQGNMLLIVTHSLNLAQRCQSRLELRDGQCVAV